ncbi:MAG: hypothetical protein AAF235_01735 [Planctomycetota bacterium]
MALRSGGLDRRGYKQGHDDGDHNDAGCDLPATLPDGRPIAVLKFGGSVLAGTASLGDVARCVGAWRDRGFAVVAVVSALAGRTDALAGLCAGARDPWAAAGVLALGEAESAARSAMACCEAGLRVTSASPGAFGMVCDGPPTDATPTGFASGRFRVLLGRHDAVVVPGYTGIDAFGRPVVLGRGGSDLTALFLASVLDAGRCVLLKDVDGLYDRDPACSGASRYARASFAQALATDGTIVQHKAVRFAASRGLAFDLGSIEGGEPTRIGEAVQIGEAAAATTAGRARLIAG